MKDESALLARLKVGDRIPWRLSHEGDPQWLIVIDVISDKDYVVRYPDGTVATLTDSE